MKKKTRIKRRSKFIYLMTGTATGLDTYQTCVVVAGSVDEAKKIHPSGNNNMWTFSDHAATWAKQENVTVTCVGLALPNQKMGSVICADFLAG